MHINFLKPKFSISDVNCVNKCVIIEIVILKLDLVPLYWSNFKNQLFETGFFLASVTSYSNSCKQQPNRYYFNHITNWRFNVDVDFIFLNLLQLVQ